MLNHPKKSISAWAEEDRPREKLLQKGRAALSDSEIIAILMGSGSRDQSAVDLARSILSYYNNDLNRLAKASVEELKKFKGVGEAKAIAIISALELGRRRLKQQEGKEQRAIDSSRKMYEYFKPVLSDLLHEEFWVLLLDSAFRPIRHVRIGQGGISSVIADTRLILKVAVESLASVIVLIHNHPSGRQKPSEEDISLTRKIKEAAGMLDILISDHLIFTDEGYFSFNDNDYL